MKKVVLLAAALVVALGVTASSATSAASETGITNRTITIGGTFPLTGPASPYAIIPPLDEGVLLVHQLAQGAGRQAWGLRPPDRVQVLRRRLQPCELGAADAEARRGGQGVCGGRLARHRGEPRDEAVPQCAQGAADPERDRRHGVWGGIEQVPVDGRLAARLRVRGPHLRSGDRPQQPERQDRGAVPERQLQRGLPARSQGGARRQGLEHCRERAIRGDGRGRSHTGREAPRLRGNGVRDPRDAEVHDPGLRDRERAQVVAGGDLHQLRRSDGCHPDAREERGRRRPPRTGLTPSSTGRTRRAPPGTTTRR